jgi:serine/threonine protein phosphatase PrpC
MEDEIFIAGQLKGKDTDYLAVFDGHGGKDAAIFASKHLHTSLAERLDSGAPPEESLREAFLTTQSLMNDQVRVLFHLISLL